MHQEKLKNYPYLDGFLQQVGSLSYASLAALISSAS
jgi:hypothetical protein